MFKQIVRELREERNKTQEELALALNSERYIVSNWEQGRTEPSIGQLIALADYFEVSIDYLTGRANDLGIVEITTDLTQFQTNLLKVVDKLSRDDQFQVLGFAQALAH